MHILSQPLRLSKIYEKGMQKTGSSAISRLPKKNAGLYARFPYIGSIATLTGACPLQKPNKNLTRPLL